MLVVTWAYAQPLASVLPRVAPGRSKEAPSDSFLVQTAGVTVSLPDIDFRRIRPFGPSASRAAGFEELACTLIERSPRWPADAGFERFGDPDGGREGRAALSDGRVFAWQVKYLFCFDSSAANQVERSLHRALDTEPALCHYLVVFPIDLPAGDADQRKSARTRWMTKVEEWREMAQHLGKTVEFEFVGHHQLVTALHDSAGAGLLRYWFDESLMDDEWFRQRIATAVTKAGHRYSPKLHTEVEAVRALEGVGRTQPFETSWRKALASLRECRRFPWRAPEGASGKISDALVACEKSLDEVDTAIRSVVSSLDGFGDLATPDDPILDARQELSRLLILLRTDYPRQTGHYMESAETLHFEARRAIGALAMLLDLAGSVATRAARSREVLIEGKAGTGKTHLLCDVAEKRVESGLPTVLVMGQEFDRRAPRNQIPELTSFDGSVEDEVAALATASEAAGAVGLLMIDALNESERPEHWRDDLRALRQIVARHDQVALVVSCRTDFLPDVVGDNSMPTMSHVGFGEAVDAAVRRFAKEYGLETVSFPVLNPEFSNPLFLKLVCEALKTLGHDRFPLGSAGLTAVCDAFLEAVNHRLASSERCDFDKESSLVQEAVRRLAVDCSDGSPLQRGRAEQLLAELLPGRKWSESLLKGLLDEGVLLATYAGIGFGYQRLGDIAQASLLCENSDEQMQEWINGLGNRQWLFRGVLEVLAMMVPERRGVELIDLLDSDDAYIRDDNLELFVQSLGLRAAEAVSDRTIQIVRQLLDNNYIQGAVCNQLVRLSCTPGHPLNSTWTHTWLLSQELAQRDALWSVFLIGQAEDVSPVTRLISWARNTSRDVSPEVRHLAGLMLGWMLATSDNRVRDQATKALVALLEPEPQVALDTLRQFCGVNDPYVVERLTGAACGIALRSADPESHHQIATGVNELLGSEWPDHLLTRDYAHRVLQLALTSGWPPPDGTDPNEHPYAGPPYEAAFPSPALTIGEIKAMAKAPGYSYSSIWFSLQEHGDFGNYVVSSTLRKFETQDEEGLFELAQRATFGRVLELGWRPEVFKDVDNGLQSGSRMDHAVERIGKKYQWIAFYEMLGQLADHLPIGERWTEDPPSPYRHAEQLIYRNIDPTIVTQESKTDDVKRTRVWFSPQQATFDPSQTGQHPSDTKGLPDPLDLIAVKDDDRRPWLALETLPSWPEALQPDEEALDRRKLIAWMQIRSYLIPTDSLPAIRNWAADKDWHGRWMPESADIHNALLASHPDDPAWKPASGETEWWRPDPPRPPCELWTTTAGYSGTGNDRGQSAREQVHGLVPSRRLYDLLDLTRADDFTWANQEGTIIVMDPSVTEGRPSTLLVGREEASSHLASEDLTIFWTVLGGKDLTGDFSGGGEDQRWVSASAAYALDSGKVVRLGAAARLWASGPEEIARLPWKASLRERDSATNPHETPRRH